MTKDQNADPQLRAAAARWLPAYAALEAFGTEEKRAFRDGVRLEHSVAEIVVALNVVGERILKAARLYERNGEPAVSADLAAEYRRATAQFGEILTRGCR